MTREALMASALLVLALAPQPRAQGGPPLGAAELGAGTDIVLAPTSHPVLPRDVSQLWFAPRPGDAADGTPAASFAAAMKLADAGKHEAALPLLLQAAAQPGPLRDYATYHAALAQLELGRPEEARGLFQAVQQRGPIGYLAEAAALGEAACAEALEDYPAALAIFERLSAAKTTTSDDVRMRLGNAAKKAGEVAKAVEAFARVYFGSPLSPSAALARLELDDLPDFDKIGGTSRRDLELARAERLFGAGQYTQARAAFDALRGSARGDERDLIHLRIAEADYHLKRLRAARDGLRPHSARGGPRQAEALYFYALSLRGLGAGADYLETVRRIVDEFPKETWAEEALTQLATHHIRLDEDDQADSVLRELYARYPLGPYAERAAWRVGWRAYRAGRYAEATWYFERAASDFPRSDYRPRWLYWAGRAHENLKQRALADGRFKVAAADYLNSYYGRLATARLAGRTPPPRVVGSDAPPAPPPPTEPLVRMLLGAGRYDDALKELSFAQQTWGDSPAVQATIAWTYRQKGQALTGREQFDLLRGSITMIRRAYPQFMAAGGEELPREVLSVIFPLAYWDLTQKHAARHDLDPYLLAALMAQESTFVPDIRSSAGAVGLMQLMPATARMYARRVGLTYSARLLTTPEANIRMGTAYLADKLKEFGSLHLALASYNAGERAVRRWLAERPGLTDTEEFIDDIPYLETQNYVKRILGTADDYRRLYGPDAPRAAR